jgi:hypothetical protein
MLRRSIQLAICLASVGIILLTCGGWWAIEQTQQVPEFYSRAIEASPESTEAASLHLQQEVEQLQSDAAKVGSWSASFSDDQINAWLIEELPRKFPQLLASGASEPRIVIEEGRLLAAVRYRNRRIDTVISCELTVELTEQPNMLALKVNHLMAGALPMPLNNFLRGITHEAAKGDIDIRWDETSDGPIALVTVPSEHPGYARTPVIVESVQLVEGNLLLAGHTGALAQESYQPVGPIHQFVSYRPADHRNRQDARLSSRRNSSADEKLR